MQRFWQPLTRTVNLPILELFVLLTQIINLPILGLFVLFCLATNPQRFTPQGLIGAEKNK
jgi:hypothetical protein